MLRPTAEGFDDLETLPNAGAYWSRFYGAEIEDVDGDGGYEVRTSLNDCQPSCAEGTVKEATLHWNGDDYTE